MAIVLGLPCGILLPTYLPEELRVTLRLPLPSLTMLSIFNSGVNAEDFTRKGPMP